MTFDPSTLRYDEKGLIPAIAQDAANGDVLMMAWMNQESIRRTLETGKVTYLSRSRQAFWVKGETSGNVQKLVDVYLDCDNDTLCFQVEQIGGIACHTGRESCFFQKLKNGDWEVFEPILKNPTEMYGKSDTT